MKSLRSVALDGWRRLPLSIRDSAPAHALRRRLGVPPDPGPESAGEASAAAADPQRVVRTIDDLERELQYLLTRAAESDTALRHGFTEFRVELEFDYPDDPFSDAYADAVLADYTRLSGKAYAVDNESTPMDLEAVRVRPFPYSTGSAVTAGNHLMHIGHLIRSLPVPAGSRVLELGFGWGHALIAMAQLGYDVHGVDIEPSFVEIVAERAAALGVDVDVRVGDFVTFADEPGRFDAVVFFESFHHAHDHVGLLRRLDSMIAPGGAIVFAGEPVFDDFPIPWGLRTDGESAWAIGHHGWLELGFRTDYFTEFLAREGWSLEHLPSGLPDGDVRIARRA